MVNKKYELLPVEISGTMGLFSNPCGGSQLSSLPVPTYPVLKGIIECFHFMPQVLVVIDKVYICKKPDFTQFGFNSSVSHLRKYNSIKEGNALQRRFSVLLNPTYQIFAHAENINRDFAKNIKIPDKYKNINHAHAFQEIFNRRLKRGSYQRPPHLGINKFNANYCGPVRLNEKGEPIFNPCQETNLVVSSMPYSWFDNSQLGTCVKPSFLLNVAVKNGIIRFDQIEKPKDPCVEEAVSNA